MSDTIAAGPGAGEQPRQSMPTWELELLISGAVLFTLFQMPAGIEALVRRIEPHATENVAPVVFLAGLYLKAIVYALFAAFVVHLVARAYWVGLIGLDAVFPHGVRWEEFKAGPITRELYRSRLPSLGRVIARTNNFASAIFSFAFLVVIIFAFTILISIVFGGIAWFVAHVLHGPPTRFVFLTLVAMMALIPLALTSFDKRFGPRMAKGSAGERTLRGTLRAVYGGMMVGVVGPVLLTLVTNVGRLRTMIVFYFAIFGVMFIAAAERLASTDRLSLNSYDYLGRSELHGVDYRFYESQRPADAYLPRTPSIQSDLIRDPYVRLFIPYSPLRHNAAIEKRCPAVKHLQPRGVQLGAEPPVPDSLALPALRCLAELHAVKVNGLPLSADFNFYEHPATGLKGIVAYIPTDSLPRGRNVIVVQALPSPSMSEEAARRVRPWVISFWR